MCVCDLSIMEEVGSARLTSLEPVTTGVGSVSRATHIEADSHGRVLWFPWFSTGKSLLSWLRIYTRRAKEIITLPQVKYEKILCPKRGKISQKWELHLPLNQSGIGKLVLSQNYIRKIPLATANASSNASVDYRKNECNLSAEINLPDYIFHRKKLFQLSKNVVKFW